MLLCNDKKTKKEKVFSPRLALMLALHLRDINCECWINMNVPRHYRREADMFERFQ